MPTPPPFSGAQEAREALGTRLDELRKNAGIKTRRALAARCGWHEAKVSRIARGLTAPSPEDVRTWADRCEALDQLDDLIAYLHVVESMWTEWRRLHRSGLRQAQESRLPLWERTTSFRCYSSWLIPGAVQTTDYTRAVLRSIATRQQLPDDVEEAVAVRADRLRLMREGQRRFAVLIEESVLRNIIGGPDVMAGQLGQLLTVMALPAVSLGIVPMGIERDAMWPTEGFWIFDDARVSVELVTGLLTVTHPRDVDTYAHVFAELAGLAVYGAHARALITTALQQLPSHE